MYGLGVLGSSLLPLLPDVRAGSAENSLATVYKETHSIFLATGGVCPRNLRLENDHPAWRSMKGERFSFVWEWAKEGMDRIYDDCRPCLWGLNHDLCAYDEDEDLS